jgi:hypothetical protein
MTAHSRAHPGAVAQEERQRAKQSSGIRRTDVRKLLAKTLWAAAASGLILGAVGSTALPASASSGVSLRGSIPRATASLYFCDYENQPSYTTVWEFPGGSARPGGNTAYETASISMPFNSIPWISTVTVDGQRWIYGEISPYYGGAYGWVGRNYLIDARCSTGTFQTSNYAISGSSYGDQFYSQPSEVSASYQGQTWVWGIDPYATGYAGWVGSSWLKLSSCNSSGCFYTINASNIHEWRLPGGASGP